MGAMARHCWKAEMLLRKYLLMPFGELSVGNITILNAVTTTSYRRTRYLDQLLQKTLSFGLHDRC